MSTNRTRVGAGFQGERGAPSPQPFSSLELSATPSFVPEASWSSVPPRNGQLPELLNGILPVTQLLGRFVYSADSKSPLCLGTALRVLTRNLALVCTRPLASALCKDPGPSVIFKLALRLTPPVLPRPTLPHPSETTGVQSGRRPVARGPELHCRYIGCGFFRF